MKSIPKFNSKKYFSNPTLLIILVIIVLIAIIFYLDFSNSNKNNINYSQNQDTSEHFSSSYLDLFSYKQPLPPIAKINRDSSSNLSTSEPVKQIEIPKKHVFLQLSKKNFLYTGLIYDKNKNEYMKLIAEQKSPESIKIYDTDENQIGKYIKNMYNTYHFELALYPDSTIDISVIDGSYNISVNLSDGDDLFYLIKGDKWIDIGYMSKKNIVGRIYSENDTYKINLFQEHKKFMNIIVLALFFYLIHKK